MEVIVGRGSVEQIRRGVGLGGVLALVVQPVVVAAAGDEHLSVGHQHRGRVVVPRRGDRRRCGPGLAGRIPDLGGQYPLGDHGLITGCLPADGQNLAVGQHGQRVVDPVREHRRRLPPRRRRRRGVENRRGVRRRGRVDHRGRTSAVEDLAREVLNRRTVEDSALPPDGRPGLSRDVHLVGHVLGRSDREDVAVGDEVGERVLLLVDLGGRDLRQQRPGVGRRVVDLRSIRPMRGVGGVAADGDIVTVGQLGERGVPTGKVHVGHPGPGVRGRIEDVGVDDADLTGGQPAVATDHDDPAVGKLRRPVAEDAVGGVQRRERAR